MILVLAVAACSRSSELPDPTPPVSSTTVPSADTPTTTPADPPPPAPTPGEGPLAASTIATLDSLFGSVAGELDREALRDLADAEDPRVAWLLADLLRFVLPGSTQEDALISFAALTGFDARSEQVPWVAVTNALIGWDTPAPPDYVRWKGQMFTAYEPRWAPFFDDQDATFDYRLLSWGGVRPDDRPLDSPEISCVGGCIPALDNPGVTDAAGGDWYPDRSVVFGVVIDGEARAYPKNIMEIHEMVIDTVGGVNIGLPYCTLCGSAQAYDLDSVPLGTEPPVLRTSGLLVRSNKVMFDLNTYSALDTFTGAAISGPLREANVELDQITVVVSTWADWKIAHPDTTIVARDGGIGRTYSLDPLGGRDAAGPIFPIGLADPRLPVQLQVVGVETAEGRFVAFPADAASSTIASGQTVVFENVELVADAGGMRAQVDGVEVPTHQSFWFAWSQFHPTTEVWQPPVRQQLGALFRYFAANTCAVHSRPDPSTHTPIPT